MVREGFYIRGKQEDGPFSRAQLRTLWETGKLNSDVLVGRRGDPEWKPIVQVVAP